MHLELICPKKCPHGQVLPHGEKTNNKKPTLNTKCHILFDNGKGGGKKEALEWKNPKTYRKQELKVKKTTEFIKKIYLNCPQAK